MSDILITNRPEARSRRSGVTILEVLVVLTVIAMISAVVGPRLVGYLGRAKSETADLQIKQLVNAVQLYYIDLGRYPVESEGLKVLLQAPPGETKWRGPYIDNGEAMTDPWGRDYIYRAPQENEPFRITSLGRDGATGGTGEDEDLIR